jgi:hypothetical protein
MKNEKLKPENLSVCESFIKELSKELNIDFKIKDNVIFRRGVLKGEKVKRIKTFSSTLYESNNIGYLISFIPNSDDSVELWKINIKNRGNGFGTKLMEMIMDVSDRTGVKIKLIPVDYDPDENSPKNYLQKLRDWYWELGFEKSKYPSIDPYYTYSPSVKEYKMVG